LMRQGPHLCIQRLLAFRDVIQVLTHCLYLATGVDEDRSDQIRGGAGEEGRRCPVRGTRTCTARTGPIGDENEDLAF
jgi:hypothetical protein